MRSRTQLEPMIVRVSIVGLIIVFIIGIIMLARVAPAFPDWTGLNAAHMDGQGHELPRAKTLWDWLQLLLVPLILLGGGYLLNQSEKRRSWNQQTRRAQDAALQSYLDQMTQLLLRENLSKTTSNTEVRSVARARTLTAVRSLDGKRKAAVLQFLFEAGLLGREELKEEDAIVDLTGADLQGIELQAADWVQTRTITKGLPPNVRRYLSSIDLNWDQWRMLTTLPEGVLKKLAERKNISREFLASADYFLDFSLRIDRIFLDRDRRLMEGRVWRIVHDGGANLERIHLKGTNLSEAHLQGADLAKAHLEGTYLVQAHLEGANLKEAHLTGAHLEGAHLEGAFLPGADLEDAHLERAHLVGANLKGAHLKGASLKDADLRKAILVICEITPEQLASAKSVENAILPLHAT